MKTLKEIFKETKKEIIYNYYLRFITNPKDYSKITREEMYECIYAVFKKNPEVITNMGTIEEANILKRLINEQEIKESHGYLDYILLNNLQENYLIYKENNNYYIPEDIFNYVKMALNIYNEEEYTYHDISDSVIIGLIRMYNVLSLEDFINHLRIYNIILDEKTCKDYLKNNIRLNKLLMVIKYKKKDYIVSLEYYYQDVLNLKKTDIPSPIHTLEEMISIGKYNLNLFKEEIFNFLGFLESHLEPQIIKFILHDLYIYTGFDINNLEVLKNISGNINELYTKILSVVNYFPCWIYNGNTIDELYKLKQNIKPNDLCPCGSGKKYKKCCGKKKKYRNLI